MSMIEVAIGLVTVISSVKTIVTTSKDAKKWIDKNIHKKKETTSSESWLLVDKDDDLVIVEVGT
tara:strand:- start:352 stop:543 length:192 start_codon:yes stop_codon:yes gene_type:complete